MEQVLAYCGLKKVEKKSAVTWNRCWLANVVKKSHLFCGLNLEQVLAY